MRDIMKQFRARGYPTPLARAAADGQALRDRQTKQNKPIQGLEGIENAEGDKWFKERRARR